MLMMILCNRDEKLQYELRLHGREQAELQLLQEGVCGLSREESQLAEGRNFIGEE